MFGCVRLQVSRRFVGASEKRQFLNSLRVFKSNRRPRQQRADSGWSYGKNACKFIAVHAHDDVGHFSEGTKQLMEVGNQNLIDRALANLEHKKKVSLKKAWLEIARPFDR